MARRAGDGLRQHAALPVEDAGREVARLAHDRGEGRAQQRLRLLLDHGDQPVPHDLQFDLADRLGHLASPYVSRRFGGKDESAASVGRDVKGRRDIRGRSLLDEQGWPLQRRAKRKPAAFVHGHRDAPARPRSKTLRSPTGLGAAAEAHRDQTGGRRRLGCCQHHPAHDLDQSIRDVTRANSRAYSALELLAEGDRVRRRQAARWAA